MSAKRFYKLVSVGRTQNGWTVELDGRPVKTPLKKSMLAPGENLARAIMAEWAVQDKTIKPETMPLTALLCTQLDKVTDDRAAMTDILMRYVDTDLVCYRTPHPPELAARQEDAWDPVLDGLRERHDIALAVTTDLQALSQPGAGIGMRAAIDDLNDAQFTVLQMAAAAGGSLALALAFIDRQITAGALFAALRVEEDFKAEIYNESLHGPDPAQEKKDAALLRDLHAAEKFLDFSAMP